MKSLLLIVTISLATAIGCGQSATVDTPTDITTAEITPVTFTLCKDCGQVKGSEKCCVEGAEMCDCGFAHGSPACCKLDKTGEDLTICTKCGFEAGSEKCCAEGAETCKCGFAHGSPACCKVDKDSLKSSDDDAGHDEDSDHDGGHNKD